MYGTLKIMVEVVLPAAVEAKRGSPVRMRVIHSEVCTHEEAQKTALQFRKLNKNLPIVRVVWQSDPQVISPE